jgi:hypothetical protein
VHIAPSDGNGPVQWIAFLEQRERTAQRARARQRAGRSPNGIGAAFVGTVRDPRGDGSRSWHAAFAVVDGDQEAEVLVTSRTHSRDEEPDPSLLARIVELAAARRRDRDLRTLEQADAGVVLEEHDAVITDLAFRTGP